MNEAKELLYIMRSFLKCEKYVAEKELDEEKLYYLAKANKVSNFLQNWALDNCKSVEIKNKIQADFHTQILKDTNENVELETILSSFEKKNIKTVVLKGAIMKNVYPQNYMRQMCDIDLLVDKSNFKTASKELEKLGYKRFYSQEKHLIFTKNFITIELHRTLLLEKDEGYEYFENIWPMCIAYENYQNVYQLKLEEAYIFCIVHLLLHFKCTGIDIRDVLDVYLYYEKYKDDMNRSKLDCVFDKLNIVQFEQNIRQIAYQWFGNKEIGDFNEVEKFILKGASLHNKVHYYIGQNKGKGRYLVQLFFPNFSIMKIKYPILKRVPVLLPFTWVARICKDIFSKEATLQNRLDTIKLIQEATDKDVAHVQEIYEKLGIIERNEKCL